ncbi:MAG: hypothetical protein ACXWQQ_06145 [Pseudobdellovibrio sp.]
MRKFVFIILVILLTGLYYFSTVDEQGSVAHQARQSLVKMVNNSSKGIIPEALVDKAMPKNSSGGASGDATGSATVKQENDVNLALLNEEQLQQWVQSEAPKLDSTQVNTAEVEVRLKAMAQTMSPEQVKLFSQKAFTIGAPINERIFETYILTLNNAPESVDAQFEVAKKALPDVGPPIPHSEAELKHSQELAIRYMTVDELAGRAKTDSNALDKLKLLSSSADEELVRKYAARKLKDLKM